MRRRDFLRASVVAGAWPWWPASGQSSLAGGGGGAGLYVASGDVRPGRAVIWARTPTPGRMVVEWSRRADFGGSRRIEGPQAGPASDNTAQLELTGLPAGERLFYRVSFQGCPAATGRLRTPPSRSGASIRFVWGADVVGQGWGIDPAHGGMLTFRSMRLAEPDFFIHCGDSIYADNVVPPTITLDDGSLWRNLVTPEKSRVAQTLDDFRGNYRYNFLDQHYREFLAAVPVVMQWDDHEVRNNWRPGGTTDERYQVQDESVLAQRSLRAFFEYWPIQRVGEPRRLYRTIPYGPDLEVFMLDLRSYRAPNSDNRQSQPGPATTLLGRTQLDWLKQELRRSRATWKVIGGEMPIATYSPKYGLDSWANGDGPPLGREHELAELLAFLKRHDIANVVWLSADVHYASAIHFDPARAVYKDFLPFWEFIAGPLHAGTYAPDGPLDNTFGAEQRFCAVPTTLKPNRPPGEGLQFFGLVEVSGGKMTVTLRNRSGREIYRQALRAR